MQVVAVGAVVIGGQDRLEIVAGPIADVAEELPIPLIAPPALGNRDRASIGQGEALDVHRIGVRMFAKAPIRSASDTAALIRRRGQFNARYVLAISALGGGAHDIALPHHQSRCSRAARRDRG